MKKLSVMVLATTLLVSSGAGAALASTAPAAATATATAAVKVNGKAVEFKVAPVAEGGQLMVPASEFMKAIEGTAAWDSMTKSVLLGKGETRLRLYAESVTAYKDGKQVQAPVKAKPVTGAVLIPVTFVAQQLGVPITVDEKTKTYNLTIQPTK